MTTYSDKVVKTKYIDPRVYVHNLPETFDLDLRESAYMPNMKLGFLGVVTASTEHSYNKLLGAGALIRNIQLLDGKTVLSQLNEAQFYKAFLNQNRSNADAQVKHSNLDLSALGLSIEGNSNRIARIAAVAFANAKSPGVLDPSASATIDLMEYFPLLRTMNQMNQHLPTQIFKNLRVVVELNAIITNQIIFDVTQGITTIRPILIVDAIVDPNVVDNMNKNMQSIAWHEVEHDQFVIPAAATGVNSSGVDQKLTVKLNGFNNKTLDNMLIVKEIGNSALEVNSATNGIRGYGKYSSQASYNQVCQFRVNGRNILPRQGITGNMERLAYVVDTFGDCANYIGSNLFQLNSDTIMANGGDFAGQLDYIGIYIGKQINDLQINYSRTSVKVGTRIIKNATNALLIGHVYGSVRKQLLFMQGGMYRIEYIQTAME